MTEGLLAKIFPQALDNQYRGNPLALYVFYGLTALTCWRSAHHLIAADGGAQTIATIPLDTYPAPAAAAIISIFGFWGLSQLILGCLYVTAALRYRAMIPLLYCLFIVEYSARFMIT